MTLVHRPTIDFIYNPDNQTKAQLIDGFVVRLRTFDRLFDDIKGTTMKHPEQHYLIEGKRGMGKTTLLLRLAYEIENDDALNEWLLPIVFNEEEYSIRRLYKLWERIAVLLGDKCGEFEGLYDEMDASFSSHPSEEEYEYEMLKLLEKRLAEKGKKLILFIDNFGDIFAKFNRQEVQRLRTVLQTNTSFRIFGASSKVLEAFYDNRHPFFEFFKVKRLTGLNKEETIDLLLKLGEAYKQEQIKEIIDTQMGRIEALRRLTGGVIRTVVLLFEIFIDQKQGSAFSDLEAILDRVTPLYKHRMDDLPAQQQEIVEAIAFAWDAVSVSEISQKTRIISKTVSAQLRQMEKNEIITKKLTNNKNHFYQISERFFNIWYLMRHGRKGDKRKVIWLVRFLEEWCDETELVARTERHITNLRSGKYNTKAAYYLSEALASTKHLPTESQHKLLKETRDYLKKNNSEYAEYLSESDLDLAEEAEVHYGNTDYKNALVSLLKMKNGNKYSIGVCYYELKDYKKAEKYYLKAVEKENIMAIVNLAFLYQNELEDYPKAEKYYLEAIEKGNDVMAIFNLAHLYADKLKDYKKAEKYYLEAVENGHTGAMNNLANLYQNELEDYPKAEKLYLDAIKNGNIDAVNNLARLYLYNLEDFDKAESYCARAFDDGDIDIMFDLATVCDMISKDYVKAEKYYLKAIEKGHIYSMNSLAILYQHEFKNYEKAEEYYAKGADKEDDSAIHNLSLFYYLQKKKKVKALKLAEKAYSLRKYNGSAHNYAKILLWNDKIGKSQEITSEFLYDKEYMKDFEKFLADYFHLLLAKNQHQFLHDYFTSPEAEALHIKDQFKPIWYALMYEMQDEHPNEYLRMGEELEETVQEIIAKVEQMRVDYA